MTDTKQAQHWHYHPTGNREPGEVHVKSDQLHHVVAIIPVHSSQDIYSANAIGHQIAASLERDTLLHELVSDLDQAWRDLDSGSIPLDDILEQIDDMRQSIKQALDATKPEQKQTDGDPVNTLTSLTMLGLSMQDRKEGSR